MDLFLNSLYQANHAIPSLLKPCQSLLDDVQLLTHLLVALQAPLGGPFGLFYLAIEPAIAIGQDQEVDPHPHQYAQRYKHYRRVVHYYLMRSAVIIRESLARRSMMQLPLVAISDDLRRMIEPFVPGLPWQDIELHFQRIPQARAPVVVVVWPAVYPAALRTAALAIGTDIYIDPEFGDFETAAGMALLVHELVHVEQYLATPNFLAEYNRVNEGVPEDQPWINPFEWEAYRIECQAYDYFIQSELYPAGAWQPLGKAIGICDR